MFKNKLVVEVIVTVDAVLRTKIFAQCLAQLELLLGGQIEHLLSHHAAKMAILRLEQMVREGSQFIVGQSEDEACHEVRRIEIEHAIVEGCIDATFLVHVMITDGRMTIKTIYLVVGLTGEQTDFYGVHSQQGGVVLCCHRCCKTCYKC